MPETQELIFAVGHLDSHVAALADTPVAFHLKAIPVTVVEMEDVLFHLDSAVMMPENPAGKSSTQGSTDAHPDSPAAQDHQKQLAVAGLRSLALVYKEFDLDPDKRLVIAGHTDTSGEPDFNFELSEKRALNVLFLLTVDRDNWSENSSKRHRVEDIQQILKFIADKKGIDCDPGKLDDTWGSKTQGASDRFLKAVMNQPPESEQLDGILKKIHGTHKWPVETWRHVFDIYMEELARFHEVPPDALKGEADRLLRFVDDNKKFVACGESFPIDEREKHNFRSQTNRRVELLLFDKDDAPVLDCPVAPGGKFPKKVHLSEECPLFDKIIFKPSYIDPRDLFAVIYHMRFVYFDQIKQALADVPEGLHFTTIQSGGDEVPTVTVFNDGVYHLKVQYGAPEDREFVTQVRFQFRTTDQSIFTASKDATPEIVKLPRADFDRLPRGEKAKHYRLPEVWSSRGSMGRFRVDGGALTNEDILNGTDSPKPADSLFRKSATDRGPHFKPFGPDVTTHDRPVVFCLEDIALTTNKGISITFQAGQGALFDKDFHVIDPDIESHRNFLSKGTLGPNVILFTKRMIGVRAILQQADLFALVGERVAVDGSNDDRAGMRVAARCGPPHGFITTDFGPEQPSVTLGKADLCFVKDWDTNNDEDISFLFVYLRWKFFGAPDPQKSNSPPFDTSAAFLEEAAGNIVNFWNRKTKTGVDQYMALTAKDAAGRKKKTLVRFYLQPVQAGEHTPIKVLPASAEGRSHMGRRDGELRADEIREDKDHAFVGAHEFGHAFGLPDEYNETARNASYRQPGFDSYTPGSPYSFDENAMMVANIESRARYYWHLAEWLRGNDGLARTVDTGKHTFRIEPHPENTDKSNHAFTTFAIEVRDDVQHGSDRSKYDVVVQVMGQDEYGKGDSPNSLVPGHAVDGLFLILLKLRLLFIGDRDFFDVSDMIIGIRRRINRKFNFRDPDHRGKWFVRGTHRGSPAVSYQKCPIIIFPRFVVRNFPQASDSMAERYAKDMNIHRTNARGEFDYRNALDQYNDTVDALDRGKHFGVTIKSTSLFEKNFSRFDSPTGRELLIGANSPQDVGEFVANAVPEMLGVRKKADEIVPEDLRILVDNFIDPTGLDTFK